MVLDLPHDLTHNRIHNLMPNLSHHLILDMSDVLVPDLIDDLPLAPRPSPLAPRPSPRAPRASLLSLLLLSVPRYSLLAPGSWIIASRSLTLFPCPFLSLLTPSSWFLSPRPSRITHLYPGIADHWKARAYRVQQQGVPSQHLRERVKGHDHCKELVL